MPHLIVVRRDQAGAYDTLTAEFEHDPNTDVRVVWNRRLGERREAIEEVDIDRERRRHRERRGPVPAVWQSLGILVVAVEA